MGFFSGFALSDLRCCRRARLRESCYLEVMQPRLPRSSNLALFALLLIASAAQAQTTTPATQPQPYRITPPPGFARVEAGGMVAYCEPVDAEWVRATLGSLPPTTRPSTMPADLAARIEGARNAMWDILSRELLYTDKAAFEKFVADQLVPEIRKFESIQNGNSPRNPRKISLFRVKATHFPTQPTRRRLRPALRPPRRCRRTWPKW